MSGPAAVSPLLPRSRLAGDIAGFVRRRIFDGGYGAGSYVRLDQLARELGVSVTPVREALVALHAEGLLAQRPHRGFLVLPVTRQDLVDVADVQAYLGGELAARAAAQVSDEHLAELAGIQNRLEVAYADAGPDRDLARIVGLNHEFHRAINVCACSPKLAQLMSQVTRFAPEAVFPTITGWADRSMRDHRRVLAALSARDAGLARTAMVDHLAAGVEPLIEHLSGRGVISAEDDDAQADQRRSPPET